MRLEWENKKLKSLLRAAGLPQIWMEAYLKLDDESEKHGHESADVSEPPLASERKSPVAV